MTINNLSPAAPTNTSTQTATATDPVGESEFPGTATDKPAQELNETKTTIEPAVVTATTAYTIPTNTSPAPTATQIPAPMPGERRASPIDGMEQVFVPGGSFYMGSSLEDSHADADEFPLHEVNLDGYWMDLNEVTNTMYILFLNDLGNQIEERAYWLDAADEDAQVYYWEGEWWVKEGFEINPVVEVTWFGANAYCRWAGRRLPSEAEWERAARGDDTRRYPPGERIDCTSANTIECKRNLAVPVGSIPGGASPYGVLEMAGNMWEWVADWYGVDYYAAASTLNPAGPVEGVYRVLRGGSFAQDRVHARAANRRHNAPGNSQHDYGFRCAQDGEW